MTSPKPNTHPHLTPKEPKHGCLLTGVFVSTQQEGPKLSFALGSSKGSGTFHWSPQFLAIGLGQVYTSTPSTANPAKSPPPWSSQPPESGRSCFSVPAGPSASAVDPPHGLLPPAPSLQQFRLPGMLGRGSWPLEKGKEHRTPTAAPTTQVHLPGASGSKVPLLPCGP